MRHRSLLLLWLCASVLSTMTCFAADPSGYGQAGGEFDIKIPRVPSGELATAKALKPPFEATSEVLADGKAIFETDIFSDVQSQRRFSHRRAGC